MASATRAGDRRVVVVTGGGGGIGAAIAEELGRGGAHVVTMDPLVSVDGCEPLPVPEQTTAGRIVAAGGSAEASSVSVTDRHGVRALFEGLVDERGRLDAVVNVAGISRPTSFTTGTDEDWLDVLDVHLGGYLAVLGEALPLMAAAGHGRILGVTSGSGWRSADAGAYGCAKRAVVALTWELGREPPPGVVVNAISPIAVTRMVTAALDRSRGAGAAPAGPATGGLSLGAMPQPADLGPLGAHLVGEGLSWCSGTVLFAGGSEVAVVEEPGLLEVVRADAGPSLAPVLESVTSGALAPAEAAQASGGGSNPRFAGLFDAPPTVELPPPVSRSCALVTDRPGFAAALGTALTARGVTCHTVEGHAAAGIDGAAAALARTVARVGPLDGIVVALAGGPPGTAAPSAWERVLAEHDGVVEHVRTDAAWARAAADHAMAVGRPLRLVTLTDAATSGGRSRAQAAAQLARAARRATGDRVTAFAVSVEVADPAGPPALGELAAHLLCSPAAGALGGAELVAGAGWFGLRSHPRPRGAVTFGGPGVPPWLDAALRDVVGLGAEEPR